VYVASCLKKENCCKEITSAQIKAHSKKDYAIEREEGRAVGMPLG